jgi:hypothetical protein
MEENDGLPNELSLVAHAYIMKGNEFVISLEDS